jgi:hypothetical protein
LFLEEGIPVKLYDYVKVYFLNFIKEHFQSHHQFLKINRNKILLKLQKLIKFILFQNSILKGKQNASILKHQYPSIYTYHVILLHKSTRYLYLRFQLILLIFS